MAKGISSAGGGSASCSTEQTGLIATPRGGFRVSAALPEPRSLAIQPLTGPIDGQYIDGCRHGELVAAAYLQELKLKDRWMAGLGLQHMVFAHAERLKGASAEERDGVRGQIVGFYSVLNYWLKSAVDSGMDGSSLKKMTPAHIHSGLDWAVDGGPAREYFAKVKADRSAQARDAAKARWAKHPSKKVAA